MLCLHSSSSLQENLHDSKLKKMLIASFKFQIGTYSVDKFQKVIGLEYQNHMIPYMVIGHEKM